MNIDISSTAFYWLLALFVWDLFWRAIALWRAAQRKDQLWFIIMVIINSAGVIPILYLLLTESKGKKKR